MPFTKSSSVLQDIDIIQIVSRKTGAFHQNLIWNLEKIQSADGFMGSYFHLKVTLSDQTSVLTFFVKAPPPEGPQRDLTRQTGIIAREIFMYEQILPKIGNGGSRKWAPECYLCKKDLIVMEDLACEGFAPPPKHLDFDFPTLKCLFACFARLHSRSLILEEKSKQPLLDFWPGIKESLFLSSGRSMMYQESSIKGFQCLVDLVLPKNVRKQTKNKVCRWWQGFLNALEPSKKHRNVISHRDVWSANFMFKKEADEPVDCRLVDFQYYSYLYPAMDLVVALYMNTNRETRDSCFDGLVKGYHDQLGMCLEEEGLDVNDVLPWKGFRESCEEARPWGLMYNVFGHQMTLLDDQAREQFAKSQQFLEETIYGDKRDLLLKEQFERNELFREKFTENIWEIFECLPDKVPE